MTKKVAILGGGDGGVTFASYLGMEGFEVQLYEDPEFKENFVCIALITAFPIVVLWLPSLMLGSWCPWLAIERESRFYGEVYS